MPVYMNSGKIVADGWTGGRGFKGSTRGPRGPKNLIGHYDVHFVFLQTGPRCRFQREAILNVQPAGISPMQVFMHSINFYKYKPA